MKVRFPHIEVIWGINIYHIIGFNAGYFFDVEVNRRLIIEFHFIWFHIRGIFN